MGFYQILYFTMNFDFPWWISLIHNIVEFKPKMCTVCRCNNELYSSLDLIGLTISLLEFDLFKKYGSKEVIKTGCEDFLSLDDESEHEHFTWIRAGGKCKLLSFRWHKTAGGDNTFISLSSLYFIFFKFFYFQYKYEYL